MGNTLKQELENNYILKNHTIENLKSLGFRRYSLISSDEKKLPYYIYRFPVNKYLDTTTLECELVINSDTGDMRVDVRDMDHDLFSMFYNEPTESSKGFLLKIKNKILSEFKKLGLEKK